jgi:16S rRNA (adenine1518-N6/adenine1519-N6)-dimethyltransferase
MTYRPTDLHALLDQLDVRPSKRLSQNFLIDGNVVRKIVSLAEVKEGDTILEIGPGPGAITEVLLSKGARVIAVEKDPAYAAALQRLQTLDLRLQVVNEDILTCNILDKLPPKSKIVANLPFHITTPILAKFIPLKEHLESIVVIVQKEVGERFVAPCSTKNYSSFTVFLQFYTAASYGFTIEPTCFYPRPRIKSAVMKLSLRQPPFVSSPTLFFKMVRSAFQQRRKMLKVSLKLLYPNSDLQEGLQSIGVNPQARPEELTLSRFIELFEKIQQDEQQI